jgi:hypothetical protein
MHCRYGRVHVPWQHRAVTERGGTMCYKLGRFEGGALSSAGQGVAESARSAAERVMESVRGVDLAAHVF